DGVDPNTGINSKTGGRMTMRIGGQMEDVLQALGLESGQPGRQVGPHIKAGPADLQLGLPSWVQHPEDSLDGMTRVLAARLSPIMNDSASLLNVDLYHTLTNVAAGQPSAEPVIPGTTPARLSPLSAAATVLYALPGMSQMAQQIEQSMRAGNKVDSTS